MELRRRRRQARTGVEATAYFLVAEALTNVAKHAAAGRAEVTARLDDDCLLPGGARRRRRRRAARRERAGRARRPRRRSARPACEWTAREGGGTVVTARIPLDGLRPPAARRAVAGGADETLI